MKTTIIFIILMMSISASADIRLPSLFSDNMILQQKTKNRIWGWADPGEAVKVKASWGAVSTTKADADGKWKLLLETPSYKTDCNLTFIGKNKIEIKNVAIGEVWLCAGQSNMGWGLKQTYSADEETSVNLPNYRIFKSAREHWHKPLEQSRDRLAKWKVCNPESAAETSAVSYWFGKKLHQELEIPVGIIVQAYAGTPIEGWMPWDIQKNDPRSILRKAEYDETAKRQIEKMGLTKEKAIATYNKQLAAYNKKIDAGETMKNKTRKLSPPIITKPAQLGNQYIANIFNAMIYPIRPYSIRGMIWYQGERNSKNVPQAADYRRQLTLLINYYRKSWNELSDGNVSKDFPFQFTQLPSWNPPQTKPDEGLEAPWAVNRESMRLVDNEVPNTGMAVAIDTGDPVALHPKNKKPVGLRHAYLALKQTYGKDFVAYGPRFKKQTIKGKTIILEFDSIGSGLMASKPEPLNSFAIAGPDKIWQWADAKIIDNKVIVSSPKISKPVAVRYAWAMNPSQRNLLYNKEGIPASPFRTDNWALFNPDDEIVKVNKPKKERKYVSEDWDRPKMTQ